MDESLSKAVDLGIASMEENYQQARQHESLRAQMSAMALGVSGVALTAAFAFPSPLVLIVFGLFVFSLGVFGERFSIKHYERFKFHVAVARATRYRIEECVQFSFESRSVAKNSRLRDFVETEDFDERIAPYDKRLYRAYQKELFRYWLFWHRGQYVVGSLMSISGVVWWYLSCDLLLKGASCGS